MLHDTCDDGQLLLQCFRDTHKQREREREIHTNFIIFSKQQVFTIIVSIYSAFYINFYRETERESV